MKFGLQNEVHRITLTTANGPVVYETVNFRVGGSDEFQHSTINDILGEISQITHTSRSAANVEVLGMQYEVLPVEDMEESIVSVNIDMLYSHALGLVVNKLVAEKHGKSFDNIYDNELLLLMLQELKTPFNLQTRRDGPISDDTEYYHIGDHKSGDLNVAVARAVISELTDPRYPGTVRISKREYDLNTIARLEFQDQYQQALLQKQALLRK